MSTTIQASYPDEEAAADAVRLLTDAGFAPTDITVSQLDANQRESSFIIRLVVVIVVWSVVGGAVGVGLGALFWLFIGPEGTTGFIIQAVVWAIFGHLIAGMWAGYLLLADRTGPELPHERAAPNVRIAIRCRDGDAVTRARDALARVHGNDRPVGDPPAE